MMALLRRTGVTKVTGDMCQFGMTQEDAEGTGWIKKPTGWATNAEKTANRLEKRCQEDPRWSKHRHIELTGGHRTRKAQVYPPALCKAIVEGLKDQLYQDGRMELGCIGLMGSSEEATNKVMEWIRAPTEVWDDATGEYLDPEGVRQGY